MEANKPSLALPGKMGLIVGMTYCVLIYCQNQFFYKSPIEFGFIKTIGYLVIVGGYVLTAYLSKKQSGGYITFREALRAILVAIVITEILYLIFSTIYVKYMDPGFFTRLKSAWLTYYQENKVPQQEIDQNMARFNDAGKITAGSLIQSLGFSIIIDSVFGVIIAAIIRKNKPGKINQTA